MASSASRLSVRGTTRLLFAPLALALLLFLLPASAAAATKTWNGAGGDSNCSTAANWAGGVIPATGDDVVFDGTSTKNYTWDSGCPASIASLTQAATYTGTGTIATTYDNTFPVLTITGNLALSGGTLTHKDNSNAETYRLKLNVGGNFGLAAAAKIVADGRGYSGQNGPGAANNNSDNGAAYGGLGSLVDSLSHPATYGSIIAPTNLGSGGYHSPGGGAILLTVSGFSTIQGAISANASSIGGRGAGGSVYLTTGTLTGTGTIRANGVSSAYYGGGGGRVAVILTLGTSFGSISLQAYGSDGANAGAAGTIYQQTSEQSFGQGTIIVDNNGILTATAIITTMPAGMTWDAYNLIVRNAGILGVLSTSTLDIKNNTIVGTSNAGIRMSGGTLTLSAGSLTINNWKLTVDNTVSLTGNVIVGASGGVITHSRNSNTEMYKMNLTINGDLTVQPGGLITADGDGYGSQAGPGAANNNSDNGAAYGGMGYRVDNISNPRTYGSITAPWDLGSGGFASVGGGAIRLIVTGRSDIQGTISANASSIGGRGAGGSVYLTTGTLTGTGTIRANGGSGGFGGGGGRIAALLTSGTSFGSVIMQAYAGASTNKGAPGTIYTKAANQTYGNLLIDNNGTTSTAVTNVNGQTATGVTVGSLTVRNGGNFLIDSDDTLTLAGPGPSLTIGTGSTFTYTNTFTIGGTGGTNAGTFQGSGATALLYTGESDAAPVTVPPGTYGDLTVDRAGTTFTQGPGALTIQGTLHVAAGTYVPTASGTTAHAVSVATASTLQMGGNGTLTLTGSGTPLTVQGTFDATSHTPNTVLYAASGARITPVTYHHLSVGQLTVPFARRDALAFQSGENYSYHSSAIDPQSGFAYFGFANTIAKVRLSDFTRVATLTLAPGESYAESMAIDPQHGFLYVGLDMSPGAIVKIRLSDFTEVATITLNPGEDYFAESAGIDPGNGFLYVGNEDTPATILRIRLSDFTRDGSLTFAAGEGYVQGPVMDLANGYAYYGGCENATNPIVKVRLSDFTEEGSFTPSGNTSCLYNGVLDPINGFAYFPNDDTPGRIIKVRLSDFTEAGSLTLQSGGDKPLVLSIDPTHGFLYAPSGDFFATAGSIVKVRLSDFTEVGAVTASSGENAFGSTVIDPSSGFLYAATRSPPSSLVRVTIFQHTQGDTYTLGSAPGQTIAVEGTLTVGSSGDAPILGAALYDPALHVGGDVLLATGATLLAPPSSPFTVAGDWTNDGTFTADGGTVTLDGTSQTLAGSTAFASLSKTVTSAATLTFPASLTQTITAALTLEGAAGNLLSLRSSLPGTPWRLDPQGSRTLASLDVEDADNVNGTAMDCVGKNCTDSGNNTHWTFIASSSSPSSESSSSTAPQQSPGGSRGNGTDLQQAVERARGFSASASPQSSSSSSSPPRVLPKKKTAVKKPTARERALARRKARMERRKKHPAALKGG